MGSTYLTELANWCRSAGLHVIEEPGWQTRARNSGGYDYGRPWCIMWHHTASQASAASDVNYIINSPDGPLSNIYLARDGTVHIIAAGATNTNGKGGPTPISKGVVPLDSMNSYAVGIEAANNGVGESWPQAQIDAYFDLSNCLTSRLGLLPTDICTHAEYAPSRKIDPAKANVVQGPWKPGSINSSGTWNNDDIRQECNRRAGTQPAPQPPDPEDDMKWSRLQIAEAGAIFMGMSDGRVMPQIEWVNGDDPDQLQRYLNYEQFGFGFEMRLSYTDLKGTCLMGSVPGRDDRFMEATGQTWNAAHFGKVVGSDK